MSQEGKSVSQGLKSATLHAWCAGLWGLRPGQLRNKADVYVAIARFDAAAEGVIVDEDVNGQPVFEVRDRLRCTAWRRHSRDALVIVSYNRNSTARVMHVMLAHLQIYASSLAVPVCVRLVLRDSGVNFEFTALHAVHRALQSHSPVNQRLITALGDRAP